MTATLVISFCFLSLGQIAIALDLGPRCMATWGHRSRVLTRALAAVAGTSLVLWAPWLALVYLHETGVGLRIWLWTHVALSVLYFVHFLDAPLPRLIRKANDVENVTCEVRNYQRREKRPRFHSARNQNLEVRQDRLTAPPSRSLRDGISLGVLADLHAYYSGDLPFISWCVDQVNRLKADLIVVAGDLTKRKKMVEPVAEIVARLEAPSGVYLALGNHDLGLGSQCFTEAFKERPVQLLRPRDGEIEVREAVSLTSSEWPFRKPARSPLAARTADDPRYRILLAHSPDNIGRAAAAGYDLVVSGHTHGGFPHVPGIGPLIVPLRYGRRLAEGWFRCGSTHLFVTRGVGYVPASPFQRKPQVARIDVRGAPNWRKQI